MSKSNTFETDVLNLYFKNTDITTIGDAGGVRGSVAAGSLYMSLHTADPTEAGTQTSSECAYTGYARQAVTRGAGFTVTGSSVSPAANVDFPICTAGSETALFCGIGTSLSGAGKLMYYGVLGSGPKVLTGAVSDVITAPAHGFVTDDRVIFQAIEGFSLPTGIAAGTRYFVLAGSTADTFTISLTSGGTAIDITVSSVGFVFKSVAIAIALNVIPRLTTATALIEA